MNCIIVEDEPAAQSLLEDHINKCPGITCKGIFGNASSAQDFLDKNQIDLIFLDINLPEMSGVSFLRTLAKPPLVIFTTAYSQYAIDGFELEIIDFLLKPFSFERFCKAVNKAKNKFYANQNFSVINKITVKSNKKIYQIRVDEILYIEACGDYVSFHNTDKKLLVLGTLKSWEEKLSVYSFKRIHRTLVVNVQKIDHIEGNLLKIADHKLPISEPYKSELIKMLFSP